MNLNQLLLNKFGILGQLKKLVEEIFELIVALGSGDKQAIITELADVSNLCQQFEDTIKFAIMNTHGIEPIEVEDELAYKRQRTFDRYFKEVS